MTSGESGTPGTPRTSGADARWFGAVAVALAGVEVAEPPETRPTPEAIVGWLADQGWSPARLAAHRLDCRDGGVPWPHPVPAGWLPAGSAARFHSLLVAVQDAAGVRGLIATPAPRDRHIGPAERRLLDDVPPHHGKL